MWSPSTPFCRQFWRNHRVGRSSLPSRIRRQTWCWVYQWSTVWNYCISFYFSQGVQGIRTRSFRIGRAVYRVPHRCLRTWLEPSICQWSHPPVSNTSTTFWGHRVSVLPQFIVNSLESSYWESMLCSWQLALPLTVEWLHFIFPWRNSFLLFTSVISFPSLFLGFRWPRVECRMFCSFLLAFS